MNTEIDLLDEEELELLHALQIGPRLPWTTLGEILGRHPTSLAARWRRLEEAGVAWLAAHPWGDPNQMALAFHDVQCAPGQRQAVIESLAQVPAIFTIEECYRDRDLMLTTATTEQTSLAQSVYARLDSTPGLLRYETAFCTRLHSSGGAWELDALAPKQRRALRDIVGPRPGPDRTAAQGPKPEWFDVIFEILGGNARASATQIATETGMHPATARRRLRAVLNSQALSFRCEVTHRAAGYPVVCQWFARLPVGSHDEAANVLSSLGALRLCASTTGRTNFTFLMWLRSAAEIMTVEQAASRHLPGLDINESVIISNNSKRVGWHLHPDGTRTGEYTKPDAAWG